ncbi:MAG: YHYH protein [Candidatus Nitronauta litoralis]|uniref:YHYH protein n=1 Tax=Candidatus Nitronauta litoralis TaxID=2705533 RepID=A0A7T0FZH7_9BACT|nr:MAG: YHYH protein [Candidatus Nitronauta litoralis]
MRVGALIKKTILVFFAAAFLNLFTWGTVTAQDLWFSNPKVKVQVSGEFYSVQSDGMPDHKWQQVNPNTPTPQNIRVLIPRNPVKAAQTTPVPSRGPIAIAINGVVFFGPEDAHGKLAIENHGLDSCQGHPAPTGMYHYHSTPACVYHDKRDQHSPVIGYAFDGFKIYGLLGDHGLPPRDLDSCNGHEDAERGYHYHTTRDFPYVLGCYRGTATVTGKNRGGKEMGRERMRPGPGRGGDRMRQACDADRRRYCPNMPPSREMHECMRRNRHNFSSTCQEAMRQHRPPPR